MWSCDGCGRHLLPGTPACPFCAGRKVVGLGMAAVTPLVLSACYGAPPCEPDDLRDADGDGFPELLDWCYTDQIEDCDDGDASVNPDAVEICGNDVDEDCDFATDDADVCATSQLALQITWSSTNPVSTCEEAGVTQLDVSIVQDGGEPQAAIAECEDDDVLIQGLVPGDYTLEVVGTATDRTWSSGPVEATALADQTVAVPLTLTCTGDAC